MYFDFTPKPYWELRQDFLDDSPHMKFQSLKVERNAIKGYVPFKMDNLDFLTESNYDFFNGEAVLYFPKKLKYIEVKLPDFKMLSNDSIKVITGISNTIKFLNPSISNQFLFDYLLHLYDSYTSKESIQKADRQNIYREIEKMIYKAGKTHPKTNATTKFLWNPDYELTAAEKKGEINRITGKNKSVNTCNDLKQVLVNWEKGKEISYTIVGDLIGKNKSNVGRQLNKPENEELKQLFEDLKAA